jgi:hypothetical protein
MSLVPLLSKSFNVPVSPASTLPLLLIPSSNSSQNRCNIFSILRVVCSTASNLVLTSFPSPSSAPSFNRVLKWAVIPANGAIESLLLFPVPLLLNFAAASRPNSLAKSSSITRRPKSSSLEISSSIDGGGSAAKTAWMSPWTEKPREKSQRLALLGAFGRCSASR